MTDDRPPAEETLLQKQASPPPEPEQVGPISLPAEAWVPGEDAKDAGPDKAADPREYLKAKATEFAEACEYAVERGISPIEVMTLAQQTLLGLGK